MTKRALYQDVEFLSKKPKMVMTFSLMKHTDRLLLSKNGILLFQIGEILATLFNRVLSALLLYIFNTIIMKKTEIKRGTKQLKRSGFKQKAPTTPKKVKKPTTAKNKPRKTKLKRDLMPARVKRAKKQLEKLSHDYIRTRDSINDYEFGGNCFDCGKYTSGAQFQCGHFEPSSTGGATLRYHPHNMHGQSGSCNCGYRQEHVKINYTLAMVAKYGRVRVSELLALRGKIIKADIFFYEKMIDLYKTGNEEDIVKFLEHENT